MVELLTQLEKCLSALVDMETQNFRQLQEIRKVLFFFAVAAGVAAATGLTLIVLRPVQLLCG